MAKAKVIKAKKKIDWSKYKIYFQSLFKNDAVKEIGLTKSIYIGAIVAIISVLISVIPLVVAVQNTNGSDFVSGTTAYNFDQGFYSFLEDAKEKGYDITFNHENNTASLVGAEVSATNNYLVYEHTYEAKDNHEAARVDFQVYFVPKETDFQTAFNTISAIGVNSLNGRDASYMVFGYDKFAAATYKYGNYSYVGGVSGDYASVSESTKSVCQFYVANKSTTLENISATLDNLKPFLDETYRIGKKNMVFAQFGIGCALNSGIIIIMGGVLWLLTRGKRNPNRGIKFTQTLNMALWATLTPAVLALIAGFIIKGYEIMMFVVIFGFRIMWLSMKQLPSYQQ